MRTLFIIFLLALTVTATSIPWIRQMALATGFVDAPHKRKLHRNAMPLLGGLGIFVGAMVVLAIAFYDSQRIQGFVLAATLIAVVGLVDDRWPLPAWAKFGGQMAAFGVAIWLGVRVQLPLPDLINIGVTLLWMATVSNAVNFIDNMDGLCGGVSAVAAAFIMLMATQHNQEVIAPMAAAVLGACLGFLRYNFKPARIFMGDTGSLLLGFLLAVMSLQLRFPENSNRITWMIPLFLLGVPLLDLALVFVSRLRRGVNPLTTAGKDHSSHRLVRLGFSQREAVLILYLMGVAFGFGALYLVEATLTEAYAIAGVTALVAMYYIYWMETKTAL